MHKKIIILIGPPGSGKGFYAKWLKQEYQLDFVSSGDICRSFASQKTDRGNKIQNIINKGVLLDSKMITDLVYEKIQIKQKNLILDGFPRNLKQLEYWNALNTKHNWKIVYLILQCDFKTCFQRIQNRLICRQCHAVYNTKTKPPLQVNLCDFDQTLLSSREDNFQIQKRFEVFKTETQPLIDHLLKDDKNEIYQLETTLPNEKNFLFLKKHL